MKRRLLTMTLGAIPLFALTGLVTFDRIPGTSISLTVPYAAEGPGPIFNALGQINGTDVVEINGTPLDKTTGELNMTTVSVRTGMTLAQVVSRWLIDGDTIVPIEHIFPQGSSEEEVQEANQLAFSSSEAAATIAALTYLGIDVGTEVVALSQGSAAEEVLEIGDKIVAIDGSTEVSPEKIKNHVGGKKPQEKITLSIERKNQTRDVTLVLGENPQDKTKAFLGISMTAVPKDGISVDYHLEDIGGPSAGMIFSLTVIDKLSPGELTQGKKIAGTGTIYEDGTVGPIGGINHKIEAAVNAGVEVFLAPQSNCASVKKRDDITIVSVDNLGDAINKLSDYAQGNKVATCY
ncbi:PDZ domain-containing protein [Corynebacterium kutscheri]|nr:PDZ domain-containing protein [Corynebacterium kutscheri]